MTKVNMTVRMEREVKENFDLICGNFGLSANAAVNVFAKAVVRNGRIPVELLQERTGGK